MNQKFKSGKKVLSLVLSVLMLMSCFVFAPVANAAEDETTVKVVYKCTNGLPLSVVAEHGDYVLTINFEDETSHVIDFFDKGDEGHSIFGTRYWTDNKYIEARTTTYSFSATSKVKSAYLHHHVKGAVSQDFEYNITVYQNGQQVADAFKYFHHETFQEWFKYKDYIFGETSSNSVYPSTATAVKFIEAPDAATVGEKPKFKAVVVDQFGYETDSLPVTYSISDGASIDATTGEATFENSRDAGLETGAKVYTVTASCGDLTAEANITVTNEQHKVSLTYCDKDGNEKTVTEDVFHFRAFSKDISAYAEAYTKDGEHYVIVNALDKSVLDEITADYSYTATYTTKEHNWVNKGVLVTGELGNFVVGTDDLYVCNVDGSNHTKTEPAKNLTEPFNTAADAANAIFKEYYKYNTGSQAYRDLVVAYGNLVGLNDGARHTIAEIEDKINAVNTAIEKLMDAYENDKEDTRAKYTVTYIVEGEEVGSQTYYYGQKIDAYDVKQYEKDHGTGYTCDAWVLESDPEQSLADSMIYTSNIIVCPNYKYIEYKAIIKGVHGTVDGEVIYTIANSEETVKAQLTALLKDENKTFFANDEEGYVRNHKYTFSGWDVENEVYYPEGKTEVTFTAQYTDNGFVEADYKDWNKAVARADGMVADEDLDLNGEVEAKIAELIKDGYADKVRDGEKFGINDQDDLDKATKALNDYLDSLFNEDGTIKDEFRNKYTVKFNYLNANAVKTSVEKNDYVKGAAVEAPEVVNNFEVKTADSDKTYVFTGWNPAVVAVSGNAEYTAQYKVVEYKAFNDLKDEVNDLDLKKGIKDQIDAIVKVIEDNKNNENGDKNTQEDVNDAIKAIEALIKDESGNIKDDVLNEYTVTFIWHNGEKAVTVVSGKAATAPVEEDHYYDDDNHYSLTGWDKDFSKVTASFTVNAQYAGEAHSYTNTIARPEATDGAKGTVTYTCDCGYKHDVEVDRADYSRYDAAVEKLNELLNNPEITDEVKALINEKLAENAIDDNLVNAKDNGYDEQPTVDKAAENLELFLKELDKDGDGKVDEDNLKHYTIRFFSENKQVGETQFLVKGAAVTVPANPTKAAEEHKTYQFKGWSPDVTEVKGDQDYVAEYNSIDYTEYDKVVDILNNADLTDDVKKAVEKIKDGIDSDRVAEPEDKNTQEEVNNAVEELKKFLDESGNIKDENLNHYTVIFNFKDKDANDVTDKSNKNLLKGAEVKVPAVEKSFEVKKADSDKTYVFTGWDPADVEANVTKSAAHTAQYKVVEYKAFNDLKDEVNDLDLKKGIKDQIDAIVKGIEDNKNNENGDKNTQKDVDDAIKAIEALIKDESGNIKDDVLNEYTVTFKWHGGDETQTVVSGKAAVAPAEFVKAYYDTAKHYAFSKWDADFTKVTSDLNVNAVYTDEAHSYTKTIARPEAKDGAKGTVTYTCECDYSYAVKVDRADYSRYDAAVEKLNELLNNPEITDEVKTLINEKLAENKIADDLVAAPDNGYNEQPTVDKAANALELFLEELNKKIDDNDPEVIKHYTVKFIWHDGSSEKSYVKGAKVDVPTVESYVYGGFTYEFTGWDKAVVAVDGNAEYNAQYTEPRSMDDVIEAEKKADDIIGNKDYYEEDRKAVEDAKKELDEYLDEKGVEIDENGNVTNNPIAKDSEEDEKITELVQKLNDAINTANKNKEERDKAFNKTGGFLGWLTRLLILVRHLLNMV